jgi:hypothetical protein
MNAADFVDRQIGSSARLIPPTDREWLVRETSLIEEVSRRLAEVDKGPLDFAAMCPPSPQPG